VPPHLEAQLAPGLLRVLRLGLLLRRHEKRLGAQVDDDVPFLAVGDSGERNDGHADEVPLAQTLLVHDDHRQVLEGRILRRPAAVRVMMFCLIVRVDSGYDVLPDRESKAFAACSKTIFLRGRLVLRASTSMDNTEKSSCDDEVSG
jgi:hypothetical protein